MKISVRSLLVTLTLAPMVLGILGAPAVAQPTQHRQSDQQFIKRLASYADQLEKRLDRLEPRVAALDPTNMSMGRGGRSTVSAQGEVAPNTKVGFSLGQSAGAAAGGQDMPGQLDRRDPMRTTSKYNRLQGDFENLQRSVRSVQHRLKKGEYDSGKSLEKEQQRLQHLERRIADLEREVYAAR